MADGPLVFNKNVEGNEVLDVLSKYGRSFSLLRIPYALKLLIQELQTMNVQMRIVTEDNIDQLLNLSYQSRNIDKLLHIDGERDIKVIIENYKKSIEAKVREAESGARIYQHEKFQLENAIKEKEPQEFDFGQPIVNVEEQEETNTESPAYPDVSPAYEPGSQELDVNATSPAYMPSPYEETENIAENGIASVGGNIAHVFMNPQMNQAFNMLSGDKQSALLQMDQAKREIVMREIMRQTQVQSSQMIQQPQSHVGGGGLTDYFTRLPIPHQIGALKTEYSNISKGLNKLGGSIHDKLTTTIIKPQTINQQIEEKFPLLVPDFKTDKGESNNDTMDSNNSSSNTYSNDTSSSSSSNSDSTVKRISI
jgi:hypothetical protein